MSKRIEFKMTDDDMGKLIEAVKPLQCGTPLSTQERANAAWAELGARMGFDGMTALPVPGKSDLYFTAIERTDADHGRERGEGVVSGWRPAGTAPTDGRYFLAWNGLNIELVSCWKTEGGKFLMDDMREFYFLQWHELPPEPEPKSSTESFIWRGST